MNSDFVHFLYNTAIPHLQNERFSQCTKNRARSLIVFPFEALNSYNLSITCTSFI